ncbi:MAG: phosphohistidine phosphatase [Epsilonproteobacteria bacterium]|nr:phosphohistidine phosphatase [Campylobacterota bacterium]NPA63919.1 phosphohistidine phosphatase [Campylobacterota bacterium]
MQILFIRHAKALERSEWEGDDLLRPLSEDGRQKAKEFFAKLSKVYHIDAIITSKAVRAVQTAQILKEYYPAAKYFETSRLNPGATPLAFEEIIDRFRCYDTIALIGHEPDFSIAVGHLVGCDDLDIRIKKAGVVELRGDEAYELYALLYPKIFKGIG